MKLESIEINNFRGIRNLALTLGGRSAAILGPNGTGKSSVVDAIDFLMRGSVRRLEGEGAGELSVAKHGVFVGASPKDSWVKAVVKSATGKTVTVRRTVANPSELESDKELPPDVAQAIVLANEGGHHLLTRRELLRFVFTEPGNRAKAVAALLHLESIEACRKELQGAAKDAADQNSLAKGRLSTLQSSAVNAFDPPLATGEEPLNRLNMLRSALSGAPLESLDPDIIVNGVVTPAVAAIHPLQSVRNQALIRAVVEETLGPMVGAQVVELQAFVAEAAAFRDNEQLQRALRSDDLIDRGLSLLGNDECPLCLTPQSVETLRSLLEKRAESSKAARETRARLDALRLSFLEHISADRQRVSAVLAVLTQKSDLPSSGLAALDAALAQVMDFLTRALQFGGSVEEEFAEIGALKSAIWESKEDVEALRSILKALPATSQLQSAWDQLSQFGKGLKEVGRAMAESAVADRCSQFLRRADECFLEARDQVLQATYDSVTIQMSALYRRVHGEDEKHFDAEMLPTRAGLRLAVEFRGKGKYPPSALHSEGHQDSMGLAFFLALSAQLAGGGLPFVVLDDVVMSVDYSHRRGVADVLSPGFPDRQFIVTTHDRIWWRQLRSAGVVSSKNSVEFVSWSIENGPQLAQTSSHSVSSAREAISRGNVPQAAHALRRALEESFPEYCDSLGASVRYRADGANEAGEFLQAALSRLGTLLEKARRSAADWNRDQSGVHAFEERRRIANASFGTEQWLVNPTLHYNSWTANTSAADFEPVVAAYETLFALYTCKSCEGALSCVEVGKTPSVLKCPCGENNWNLELRPRGA